DLYRAVQSLDQFPTYLQPRVCIILGDVFAAGLAITLIYDEEIPFRGRDLCRAIHALAERQHRCAPQNGVLLNGTDMRVRHKDIPAERRNSNGLAFRYSRDIAVKQILRVRSRECADEA